MSDCPMLISNKLHSFRNFRQQKYIIFSAKTFVLFINYRYLTVEVDKRILFRIIVMFFTNLRVCWRIECYHFSVLLSPQLFFFLLWNAPQTNLLCSISIRKLVSTAIGATKHFSYRRACASWRRRIGSIRRNNPFFCPSCCVGQQ